jgi:hypothetical protein
MTKVAFVIQIKFKKKIEYVGYDINILGTVNNVVWDQKCGMIFSSSVQLKFKKKVAYVSYAIDI